MINVYDGFSAGEYMKKKILLALLSAAALTGCANMESLGSDQEVVAAANQSCRQMDLKNTITHQYDGRAWPSFGRDSPHRSAGRH